MAEWFEVYEDAAGRLAAHLRVRRLAVWFALVAGAVISGAPVAALRWPRHSLAVAVVAGAVLAGSAVWLGWRVARVRRAVWRVDVSVHHIVGHDVSGLRRVLGWSDVRWVDVGDAGVEVVGRRMGRRVSFSVPPGFPDFPHIGNRVVRYAETFRRPVYVDGHPTEALVIDSLMRPVRSPPMRRA